MYKTCVYVAVFNVLDSVLKDYIKKKNEMEKYEQSVNFTSLNAQINGFKNQEIETSSIAKVKTL